VAGFPSTGSAGDFLHVARQRYVTSDELSALRYDTGADGRNLRVRLIDASNGNIDPLSDISPIRSLAARPPARAGPRGPAGIG
jgi:hypothetical protein